MCHVICIQNLDSFVDEARLQSVLSPFGKLARIILMKDPVSHLSLGRAYAEFDKSEDAVASIRGLDGKNLNGSEGKTLSIRLSRVNVISGGETTH